eukprot:3297766-Prymnesium_polylepis.3
MPSSGASRSSSSWRPTACTAASRWMCKDGPYRGPHRGPQRGPNRGTNVRPNDPRWMCKRNHRRLSRAHHAHMSCMPTAVHAHAPTHTCYEPVAHAA